MNELSNPNWLQQLASIGADTNALSSNNAIVQLNSLQFMDRSDLCVVSFTGADVEVFLQSQTCNDLEKVSANSAQLNGYCSPKGRLLALPLVASDANGQTFFWLMPKDIVDATVKRLTMFVLRADVKINIESDWAVMGLAYPESGPESGNPSAMKPWLGDPSADPLTVWEAHGHYGLKARNPAGQQRSLLFGPIDALIDSLKNCTQTLPDGSAEPVWSGAESWWWGDIEAGVPSIVAATQDSFVPQMVNLEPLEGLSFTKGCYPGQEIVARMQYLGKLKRTMVRFSADALLGLSPGDSISAGDDANAGEVVCVVNSENASACLAVIKTSADQASFNVDGVKLNVQALPYS